MPGQQADPGCGPAVAAEASSADRLPHSAEGSVVVTAVRWWAVQDSNLRRPRCKRGALTTELTAPGANSRASRPDCGRGHHRSWRLRSEAEPRSAADNNAMSRQGSWCPGRDLNPDGFLHTPLKRTRIPIPPPGHEGYVRRTVAVAKYVVPRRGFEPLQPCGHWLLKPARLPIPPPRRTQRRCYPSLARRQSSTSQYLPEGSEIALVWSPLRRPETTNS